MGKGIRSLHHVTATVSDAQQDLDCYIKALGMRLVKRTVNFDNNSVYHFYYGDEHGTPNTLMTTFPYKGRGVPVGQPGWEVVNEAEGRTRLAVNGDKPGHCLDVIHAPDAPAGVNGLGTVHHVAMAVADSEEQLKMREELIRLGFQVTPVRNRQYFQSIYFREPGGVLYEVATIPPGFTVDEELSALGLDLKLPPWQEPNRPSIERGLASVTY